MADLHPFRALRYTPAAGDPARLLAPPYDVIAPEEAADLRARSPHNAVRLVLPEGEGAGRYRRAARTLGDWRERGVLARDPESAIYLYRQRFTDGEGGERTRAALVAALELVPLDGGEVLPHEDTHRGPREDRLALMEATQAQLSPVFLVARDGDGALRQRIEAALAGESEPVLSARTPDGIGHELRRLRSGGATCELLQAAGEDLLLIADGHHRYETALALRRRHPDSTGAERVLACVVSGRDPGLRILPTHRTLRRPPEGADWPAVAEAAFRAEPVEDGPASRDAAAAAERGDGSLVVRAAGRDGRGWRLEPRPEALDTSGLTDAEARLGPVLFDRLVLRARYGLGPEEAADSGLLSYHREPARALEAAGPRGAVFYLAPLSLGAVWQVCAAGRRLPPKSTYFWPKVPSGLLFRPLEE